MKLYFSTCPAQYDLEKSSWHGKAGPRDPEAILDVVVNWDYNQILSRGNQLAGCLHPLASLNRCLLLYSSPPLFVGGYIPRLQWMPGATDSMDHCIHCFSVTTLALGPLKSSIRVT